MIKTSIKPIVFLSLLIGIGYSQFQNPVTVSATSENSVRPGEVAYIQVEAKMDDEWHIYALENAGGTDWSSQIAVLEEKVNALSADHGHTKILVNEKQIELLQVQIEEIKVSTSNPLAN